MYNTKPDRIKIFIKQCLHFIGTQILSSFIKDEKKEKERNMEVRDTLLITSSLLSIYQESPRLTHWLSAPFIFHQFNQSLYPRSLCNWFSNHCPLSTISHIAISHPASVTQRWKDQDECESHIRYPKGKHCQKCHELHEVVRPSLLSDNYMAIVPSGTPVALNFRST